MNKGLRDKLRDRLRNRLSDKLKDWLRDKLRDRNCNGLRGKQNQPCDFSFYTVHCQSSKKLFIRRRVCDVMKA